MFSSRALSSFLAALVTCSAVEKGSTAKWSAQNAVNWKSETLYKFEHELIRNIFCSCQIFFNIYEKIVAHPVKSWCVDLTEIRWLVCVIVCGVVDKAWLDVRFQVHFQCYSGDVRAVSSEACRPYESTRKRVADKRKMISFDCFLLPRSAGWFLSYLFFGQL